MKHFDKFTQLFNQALTKSNLKHSNKNRLLSESDYFGAYLNFIHNSVHYSRFSCNINNHVIKGKCINFFINIFSFYAVIICALIMWQQLKRE
jgi:hypothetical protein